VLLLLFGEVSRCYGNIIDKSEGKRSGAAVNAS
jgi:hypothetical protein